MHVFIRFEPKPDKRQQLLEELLRVVDPSRAEPGCIQIHLYEATREPFAWFIHSEWVDEAAFEIHAEMPHTRHFLAVVQDLIVNPFHAARTKLIA